jgi:hypothetical protein
MYLRGSSPGIHGTRYKKVRMTSRSGSPFLADADVVYQSTADILR